jgi:hypothetical protein
VAKSSNEVPAAISKTYLILADDGGEVLEGSAGGHLEIPLPENVLDDLLLVVETGLQVLHVELNIFVILKSGSESDPFRAFRIRIRIPD